MARRVARGREPFQLAGREVELRPAERGDPARGPVERGRRGAHARADEPGPEALGALQVAVDVVTREQLVAAEAREHDGHVLAEIPVQQEQLQRVDLRLLGVADRLGEVGEHGLGQHELVMIGLVGLGDEAGVVELVPGLVEPEAERLDRARPGLAHHRDDGARVDAAGERHAERDVGEQLAFDGLGEVGANALHPLAAAARVVGRPVDARERVLARRVVVGDLEDVPGGEPADAAEQRARPGDVAHVHRQMQARLVELGADDAAREDRFGFRAERDLLAAHRVDDGLHADGVADDEERAPAPVEEREGEDAVELRREPDPFLFVEVGEDLGVARGVERVPVAEQVLAQLRVVVDQPVEDDDDVAVLVGHRLPAAGRVEDREAPVAEADAVARVEAVAVGTAVGQRVGHRLDEGAVSEAERAGDPAHQERGSGAEVRLEVVDHPLRDVDLVGQQPGPGRPAELPRRIGEQLLDGRDRVVVPVLGEVPHEPVATFLVVGVAATGGRDHHGRHTEHRGLRRHRRRLADDHLCVGEQVVDVLDGPAYLVAAQVVGQLALGGDQDATVPAQLLDEVALLRARETGLVLVVDRLPGDETHERVRLVGREAERRRASPDRRRTGSDAGTRARGSRRR